MCHALISIWKNEGGKGDTNNIIKLFLGIGIGI